MENVQEHNNIETERLLLRPFVLSDVSRMTGLLNNLNVSRWTANIPYPYAESDAQQFIEKVNKPTNETKNFAYALVLKSEGLLIGSCGAHERILGEFEVGYWLGESYWGYGYATEAALALTLFLKSLKPKRVYAGYADENPASKNVLKKAGFVSACETAVVRSKARQEDVRCNYMELAL